jgi:hypothetical protein
VSAGVRGAAKKVLAAIGLQALLVAALSPAAPALPPPAEPRGRPSSTPTPEATPGTTFPYGSTLFFVLDDKIDSGSTAPGTTIHMHLRTPLVVNGATIAPARAPATLQIVTTRKAQTGDEDGAVQVHLDPFALPGRNEALPIRAFHEYLTIERTGGQLATRDTTDTIGDIFIPGHVLYHAFRKGQQFILPPGAVLRTQTAATIDATNPRALVLSTPPPFESTYDTPHSDLTAQPLYTPAPMRPRPLPHGRPSLPPSPTPTVVPTTPPSTPPATAPANGAPSAAPSAVAS